MPRGRLWPNPVDVTKPGGVRSLSAGPGLSQGLALPDCRFSRSRRAAPLQGRPDRGGRSLAVSLPPSGRFQSGHLRRFSDLHGHNLTFSRLTPYCFRSPTFARRPHNVDSTKVRSRWRKLARGAVDVRPSWSPTADDFRRPPSLQHNRIEDTRKLAWPACRSRPANWDDEIGTQGVSSAAVARIPIASRLGATLSL